jgi:hypothetical protein
MLVISGLEFVLASHAAFATTSRLKPPATMEPTVTCRLVVASSAF